MNFGLDLILDLLDLDFDLDLLDLDLDFDFDLLDLDFDLDSDELDSDSESDELDSDSESDKLDSDSDEGLIDLMLELDLDTDSDEGLLDLMLELLYGGFEFNNSTLSVVDVENSDDGVEYGCVNPLDEEYGLASVGVYDRDVTEDGAYIEFDEEE